MAGRNHIRGHPVIPNPDRRVNLAQVSLPVSLRRRPPGQHRIAPVDPVEHVGELRRADRDCAADRRRPHEPAPLQTLGVEREAQAVVPQDLYEVAPPSAEDVQIPRHGDRARAPAGPAAPACSCPRRIVRHPGRQPHPHTARNRDHRRSRTANTRASAEASTVRSTITGSRRTARSRSVPSPAHPARRYPRKASASPAHRPVRRLPAETPPPAPSRELPAPGEHLIGIDVMTPGSHRDRSPGLVGLRPTIRRFFAALQRRRGRGSGTWLPLPAADFSASTDIYDRVHLGLRGHFRSAHFKIVDTQAISTNRTGGLGGGLT